MRYSLFLFILALLFRPSICAQKSNPYRPFIEDGKIWISVQDVPNHPFWGSFFRIDYFDGDTIVGGQMCKRWKQKYIRKNGSYIDTTPDRVNEFVFTVAAYEENRKVWFFFDGEDKPRLWFDFGADIGDVFTTTVPYAIFPRAFGLEILQQDDFTRMFQDSVKILGREELFVGGQMQNIISFQTIRVEGIESNKYLMEGIGSTYSCDWTMPYPYGNSAWPYPNARLCLCVINNHTLYTDLEMIDRYPVVTSLYSSASLSTLLPNHREASYLKQPVNQSWFDLSGRRVGNSTSDIIHAGRKGVYIKDGRKVIVK